MDLEYLELDLDMIWIVAWVIHDYMVLCMIVYNIVCEVSARNMSHHMEFHVQTCHATCRGWAQETMAAPPHGK